MSDPYEAYLRVLPQDSRAEERVAWLGREEVRPTGDCLAPGTAVLCHPRFPGQFKADHARHRSEFRQHGFTWTTAAAEVLALERLEGLPKAGPEGWVTAGQRMDSMTASRKEMSDLDLNLRSVVGRRFPHVGNHPWWDGVVIPHGVVARAEVLVDLSEAYAAAWEAERRERELRFWPAGFRQELAHHNRLLVYRLSSNRGDVVDVVVAFLTPWVLRVVSGADSPGSRDGLRLEWEAWDMRLPRLVRTVLASWRASQPRATEVPFTFCSYGLDIRHRSVPEGLVATADAQTWECFWAADGQGRFASRSPSRIGFGRHLRDFTDELLPETQGERLDRVQRAVAGLRKDRYPGSINIGLLRGVTPYRRSVLRDLLLILAQRDGTGEDGFAVRLPKGKSRTDLDSIEVMRPTEVTGRAVRPGWYRPAWWMRWVWWGVPSAAGPVVSSLVEGWLSGVKVAPWGTVLISMVTGILMWAVNAFSSRRAKDMEEE